MTPEQQAFVEALRRAVVGQKMFPLQPSTVHMVGTLIAEFDTRMSTLEAHLVEIQTRLVAHVMTEGSHGDMSGGVTAHACSAQRTGDD